MIGFKEFLSEASHKNDVSIEEAVRLIEKHCKDAGKLFHRPLWRGTRGSSEEAYVVHAEGVASGGRRSANTSNYYTAIMDRFLPERGYPKRSKSIILGNNENKDYTRAFGQRYAVFPYDGTPIGVCAKNDLWHSPPFTIGNFPQKKSLTGWNELFRANRLMSASWPDFRESLMEVMERDDEKGADFRKWFGPRSKVDDNFREAYSPETLDMQLCTPATIDGVRGDRELWIGGKCVAIREDVWEKMMKEKGLAP